MFIKQIFRKEGKTMKRTITLLSFILLCTFFVFSSEAMAFAMPTVAPASTMPPIEISITGFEGANQETINELVSRFESTPLTDAGQSVAAGDAVRITLDQCYCCRDIRPDDISGSYIYLKENDGSVYFVCRGSIENLGEEEIVYSCASIPYITPFVLLFRMNDTEYLLGDMIFANHDNDSLDTHIAPGDKVSLYLFCSIPDDGSAVPEKATVYLGFADFREDILKNAFGSFDINWDLCSAEIKTDFETIADNTSA